MERQEQLKKEADARQAKEIKTKRRGVDGRTEVTYHISASSRAADIFRPGRCVATFFSSITLLHLG